MITGALSSCTMMTIIILSIGSIGRQNEARAADDPTEGYWAWQPLKSSPPPEVSDASWCRNDIDRFILARLDAAGIEPAEEVSREHFIRRATFDLTGLPPTLDEVESFLRDDAPDAWERLVDRLLESPHYGERWGRHWLDVVRYAETNGFERDSRKPEVWRYRDWVVESLNDDKPYDRMILEQIAGDELPERDAETVAATGMHRLGLWDDEPTDRRQALADDLDSIVDTTIRATLGISIGCARCHDHKADPISQVDYYELTSFFSGIKPYRNVEGGTHIAEANILREMPLNAGDVPHEILMERFNAEGLDLAGRLRALERSGGHEFAPATETLVASYPLHGPTDEEVLIETDLPTSALGHEFTSTEGPRGVTESHLRFDGKFIEIKRPIEDDFTITLFLRTSAVAPGSKNDPRWFLGAGLVDGEISGIVRDFGISMIGDGVIAAGTGAPETFVSSSAGFNDGRWHHVAFTRSRRSGEIALYVDGVLAQRAVGSTDPLDANETLSIGRLSPGHGAFDGLIRDVRFHESVFTHDEVLAEAHGLSARPGDVLATIPGLESEYESLRTRIKSREMPRRNSVRLLSLQEHGTVPAETRVLGRGSVHAPGEVVTPATPAILADLAPLPEITPSVHGDSSGRRLALARWITDERNAAGLRTAVNRLWHHHFGLGIVPTTNDFGRLGLPPSHPDLLDWLSRRFVEEGRSLKSMHRLIMNSSTYRQSSVPNRLALELDPENRLLSRFRLRRLDAEEIRDAMLDASGELRREVGGPSVRPPMPKEILATSSRPESVWQVTDPDDVGRRSLYISTKRSLLDPLLTVFDLADPDNPCPERYSTTQPTQSLTMINGVFANQRAAAFAERLMTAHPDDLDARIGMAIALTTSRRATREEIDSARELIDDLMTNESLDATTALTQFCLIALNLNEFLHVD